MKRRNRGRKAEPVPDGVESKLITLHHVADYLKLHYITVYGLVKTRGLPAFRLDSDFRVRRTDLVNWIPESRVRPDDNTPPALGRKRKF